MVGPGGWGVFVWVGMVEGVRVGEAVKVGVGDRVKVAVGDDVAVALAVGVAVLRATAGTVGNPVGVEVRLAVGEGRSAT
jgi:hypothetical protein